MSDTTTPVTVTEPRDTTEFERLLRIAEMKAHGNSNDAEIDQLREALREAADLLDVAWPELTDEEIEAAENDPEETRF